MSLDDIRIAALLTIHVTSSAQGGVVKEPEYDQHGDALVPPSMPCGVGCARACEQQNCSRHGLTLKACWSKASGERARTQTLGPEASLSRAT